MKDKIDTLGWDINCSQLLTPQKGVLAPYIDSSSCFYESPDKKYSCLFYGVTEYRMSTYGGVIGVFENKNKPALIANPKNQWFDWQGDRSLIFSDNFLFLRKLAYNQTVNLSGTPFVVFDLDKRIFGFVDFDWTSIYYSPVKIDKTMYRFNLDCPEELKEGRPSSYGQTFDLATIRFYSFSGLDNLLKIYFDEKKRKA